MALIKLLIQHSLKHNLFLFYLFLCLSSSPFSFAQFHFNNPLTTERTNVPTSCRAPNGKESLCVAASRCKQLSALLKNLQKPISGDIGKYIKDSFICKNKLKGAKSNEVCCPLDGIKTRSNTFENEGWYIFISLVLIHLKQSNRKYRKQINS